jgi:hypothetical protein
LALQVGGTTPRSLSDIAASTVEIEERLIALRAVRDHVEQEQQRLLLLQLDYEQQIDALERRLPRLWGDRVDLIHAQRFFGTEDIEIVGD